ncbi:MAG: hypothetical protein QOF42_3498, partial [Gammaproteobacteria bacterium]|nr:hypothetical protein [Gammaproteobacteria bacterium]
MQLSKISYYSDFVVYPIVVVALTAAGVSFAPPSGGMLWLGEWLLACLCGIAIWT